MKGLKQQILIAACFVSMSAISQTVHVDSGRIVYRNTVKVASMGQAELFSRAQKAIADHVTQQPAFIKIDSINKEILAQGSIRLRSPYHLIKTVEYKIELAVHDGSYQYWIDSVYLKEEERGGKSKMTSSSKLLKGMDVSGPESSQMEKQLNEIDLNLQKLIELMNAEMKRA